MNPSSLKNGPTKSQCFTTSLIRCSLLLFFLTTCWACCYLAECWPSQWITYLFKKDLIWWWFLLKSKSENIVLWNTVYSKGDVSWHWRNGFRLSLLRLLFFITNVLLTHVVPWKDSTLWSFSKWLLNEAPKQQTNDKKELLRLILFCTAF